MATLQQQIAESPEVSAEKVEKLRLALTASKRPKADDFMKIFIESDHEDIK